MAQTEQVDQSKSGEGAAGAAVLLVSVLVGIYMVSQFFRNSIGVIAPNLAAEFDLKAADLSWLSSIFFLSFAAAQIPLGIAIDRWGPKAAMMVTAAVMVVATFLFARASGFTELLAARLLLGLGCSSLFMAPLAIYADRFSPQNFATMTGVQLGAGSIGTLIATAPLAVVSARYGWREAFFAVACFSAVMALLALVLVKESPVGIARRQARSETIGQAFAGVWAAMRVKSFWPLFFMLGATYSGFAAIAGLWAGPWLAQTYGLGLEPRGNLMLWLAAAQIVGLFIWGSMDRWFGSYKKPILIGALASIGILMVGALVVLPVTSLAWFMPLYGFLVAYTPLATAHGKSLFPPELIGRGMTLLNIGNMGGVFFQQTVTGLVVESYGAKIVDGARIYPPEAYRAVFAVIGLQLFLALVFYLRAHDPHPAKASY